MSTANVKNGLDKESLHTLNKIKMNADEMMNPRYTSFALTFREVMVHVDAFAAATEGSDEATWPEDVKECHNTLKALYSMVSARPEAKTGDEDKELKGKENYINPFKIPAKRRIQALVVSMFLFFTILPFCTFLTFLFLFIPVTMPFMLGYLGWIFYQNKTRKHPLPRQRWWARHVFFRLYRDYFPIRLAVSPEVRAAVDPKKNYLFCYHPHGVHSFGAMINFGSDAGLATELFPGIKFHLQTLGINFIVPFWRETMIWGGCGDASASCLRKTLTAGPGESAVLVVGGAEESLMASPHTNDLTLTKRKGFVKIALQTGADLVPIFGFGETDVYGNLADGRPKVQAFMRKMQKKIGFALPLISGRGYFNYNWGILPHRRPIITVVGAPVVLPKIEKPSQEEIDKYHQMYVEALMQLYAENKNVYSLMSKTCARVVE